LPLPGWYSRVFGKKHLVCYISDYSCQGGCELVYGDVTERSIHFSIHFSIHLTIHLSIHLTNSPLKDNKMKEAVIVATACTPIGKAYRGVFNRRFGATLIDDIGLWELSEAFAVREWPDMP